MNPIKLERHDRGIVGYACKEAVGYACKKTLRQLLKSAIRITFVALITFPLFKLIPDNIIYVYADPSLSLLFIACIIDSAVYDILYDRYLRPRLEMDVLFPPVNKIPEKKKEIDSKIQPKVVEKRQWFEEETNNREQTYFSSLYKTEKSPDHRRQHFHQYRKEDDQLKAGTYPITPGSPWESFAKEMQEELKGL